MKQTMIKFIISFFICAINVIVHGQNFRSTNIDTNYFKPTWHNSNLKTTLFRNGESISVCQDTNTWKFLNSKTNPSLVFMNDNEYYYNYFALIDERNLCPIGYKVPDFSDFLKTQIKFYPSGMLDYSDGAIVILSKSNNSTYFATRTISSVESMFYCTSAHLINDGILQIEEWPIPKNSGLSVRCISDLDEIIQDSTFEYKKLLPTEYRKLLYDLYSETKQNATTDSFTYQLKGELNCESIGLISGRFFSEFIVDGKMNKELLPKMNDIIQDFQEIPYYHGEILKAHSDLSLVFKLNTIELEKETFYLYMLKTQKVNGLEELNYAEDHSFNINEYKEILKIEDDGIVAFDESINYLSSFKSRGPVYTIGCVIPGLGMTLLTQNNSISSNRNAFKKTLLISSLSLGAISLGSKLISNFYYNRYKDNLFGISASDNYKKANTLQKVFLTTGIGYCILGAIDFTATFAIGSKNKSIQNKLNNQIKGSPADFILK